jgi:hypothetical protein
MYKSSVLILWDFDDPRLSPIYSFKSIEVAKASVLETIPNATFRQHDGEISVDVGDDFVGTIRERDIIHDPGRLYNLPPGLAD